MKQIYLVLFLLVSFFSFSQQVQGSGDIDGFKLYPNPTINGKVYIDTALDAPKEIFLFDVLGTQVLQTTILGKELNLSSLDKGVYILRVLEKDKVATRKLVIK
ncbi:MAG: T9SS type A sorting domain-containing protein [Bacteroidota bacterium]